MYNYKPYDKEKSELTIKYVQEQLQVSLASLMNKAQKYKFLDLAINTLIDDVKKFYNEHSAECVKGTDMQNVLDSLNDGTLGEVIVDCTVACACINIVEKHMIQMEFGFDINFDLSQFHVNNELAKIMPLGYESRLTEDEAIRRDDLLEIIRPGLRFVDVSVPRTKYFNLFGNLEDAQKIMACSHKGKKFDLDNPGDDERNVIRNLDDYLVVYEMLTYKHPNSTKYNFAKNIDEALAYLDRERESDYEDYFENTDKADELNELLNGQDEQEDQDVVLDDESVQTIYKFSPESEDTIDEQYNRDKMISEDLNNGLVYTNIQSHLEDIWVFNNILKKMCSKEFGDSFEFCTTKKISELCDDMLGELENHGLDFENYDGLKEYEEGQQYDIEYYLDDLMEDEDLKKAINIFYINYCDYNYYQHGDDGSVYLN